MPPGQRSQFFVKSKTVNRSGACQGCLMACWPHFLISPCSMSPEAALCGLLWLTSLLPFLWLIWVRGGTSRGSTHFLCQLPASCLPGVGCLLPWSRHSAVPLFPSLPVRLWDRPGCLQHWLLLSFVDHPALTTLCLARTLIAT